MRSKIRSGIAHKVLQVSPCRHCQAGRTGILWIHTPQHFPEQTKKHNALTSCDQGTDYNSYIAAQPRSAKAAVANGHVDYGGILVVSMITCHP